MRALCWVPMLVGFLLSGMEFALAEQAKFADAVEASVVFRLTEKNDLLVYLVLKNVRSLSDGAVTWECDFPASGIKVEVLDGNGAPVERPGGFGNVWSSKKTYEIPHGSTLEWLVSHDGFVTAPTGPEFVKLQLNAQLWLLRRDKLSNYRVKLRLKGIPGGSTSGEEVELLNLPATPIVLKD